MQVGMRLSGKCYRTTPLVNRVKPFYTSRRMVSRQVWDHFGFLKDGTDMVCFFFIFALPNRTFVPSRTEKAMGRWFMDVGASNLLESYLGQPCFDTLHHRLLGTRAGRVKKTYSTILARSLSSLCPHLTAFCFVVAMSRPFHSITMAKIHGVHPKAMKTPSFYQEDNTR